MFTGKYPKQTLLLCTTPGIFYEIFSARTYFSRIRNILKTGTYKKTQIKQSVGDKMLKFEAIPLSHSLCQTPASALRGFLNAPRNRLAMKRSGIASPSLRDYSAFFGTSTFSFLSPTQSPPSSSAAPFILFSTPARARFVAPSSRISCFISARSR